MKFGNPQIMSKWGHQFFTRYPGGAAVGALRVNNVKNAFSDAIDKTKSG
jgi:hypothetical protein